MTTEEFEILFRCKGRGTHPSREVGHYWLAPDTGEVEGATVRERAMERLSTGVYRNGKRKGDARKVWTASSEPGQFVCPTCGRDLQLKPENLVRLMERLHSAGVTAIDISNTYITAAL